jgi:hypothetical protein
MTSDSSNANTETSDSEATIAEHAWRIKDGKVYWGSSGKPMRGADPESFSVLNQIWAKDAKHVFVQDSLIRDADAESFEVFNALYARDSLRAYYSYGIIKTADPATFHALDKGIRETHYRWKSFSGFAADKNDVYHYTLTIGKPSILKGADPATFIPLGCDYGKDANSVYFQHTKVPKADPATFRLLGLHYARDFRHIFYCNRIVDEADLSSFVEDPIDSTKAMDRFRAYKTGTPEADAT